MLDVYSFINSRDIREYLRKMQYSFTTLEAAWLIWQSWNTTIEERHAAWRELINTMPDCAIEQRPNTFPRSSLHAYLQVLMDLEDELLERFLADDSNAVYLCRYAMKGCSRWQENDGDIFSSFSESIKAISDVTEEEAALFEISKRWIDEPVTFIRIQITPQNRMMQIHAANLTQKEYEILHYGFDGMWLSFPIPFSKGDIVYNCRENEFSEKTNGNGPFVLDTPSSVNGCSEQNKHSGDYTDMNAWGFFQNTDTGAIYRECMHCYMDLEYYRQTLVGKKRVLKALHSYLKGHIDIALYSCAYHAILTEVSAEKMLPVGYTNEGYMLAGLKDYLP